MNVRVGTRAYGMVVHVRWLVPAISVKNVKVNHYTSSILSILAIDNLLLFFA